MTKAGRGTDGEKGQPALHVPGSPPKPRGTHWTVMSDRGLPLGMQEDVMDVIEDMVDHVKIVDHVGHMDRWSAEFIGTKLARYRRRGVPVFPGGIPFEIAYLQGKVDEYFARLTELGFDGVEISDDTLPTFPLDERASIIRNAAAKGLGVFTETGKKFGDGPMSTSDIVDCIKNDLDAGATKVTVENADLLMFLADDPGSIVDIVEGAGLESVLFEVGPGGWPELAVFLIKEIGPGVNVENVEWERIIHLGGMRRGMYRAIGYSFLRDPA